MAAMACLAEYPGKPSTLYRRMNKPTQHSGEGALSPVYNAYCARIKSLCTLYLMHK
jgi:hypothetical protein